jgi:sterol 24-C-methyltransferase
MFQGAIAPPAVKSVAQSYIDRFDAHPTDGAGDRTAGAIDLTREYYDLVTDFYEYGWGQSFHFAPRFRGESLEASLARSEYHLALRLGAQPGMKLLDLGCGVGGPARAIARFCDAHVTGVNISNYQVERGRFHNRRDGLEDLCQLVAADFCKLPFAADSFDGAYTIAACCHAADRRAPFGEAFRVLKPGAYFAGHEWCVTGVFDARNPEHLAIKRGIEKGNGIADLAPTSEVERALTDVGFELVELRDWAQAGDPATPWYSPLAAGVSLAGFRNSRVGAAMTHWLVRTLEVLRLAPVGTTLAHDVMRLAQRSLVAGGKLAIFTPMYLFVARKPVGKLRLNPVAA